MKRVSIGVEDFKEMIDMNYYYVDKTNLIKDLIGNKVVLYTRPRRFGKTLNMSMLNYFFHIKEKENAYLFQGLEISRDNEAIIHQNKYPVISITLKEMKQSNFQEQLNDFKEIIVTIISSYKEVLHSCHLDEVEKEKLYAYYKGNVNEAQLGRSLLYISQCLEKHYGEKVVILIDEYDVPLQQAYIQGYYDEMVGFLRNVFSAVLKTNTALQQGVLTGCLRIAKESIFTGLNNFMVNSIFDFDKQPRFGFTETEVQMMLDAYGFHEHMDEVKRWYDGYKFGDAEVYNPWSTTMYVAKQLMKETKQAESFWANTSSNDLVMKYIQEADTQLKKEFDILIHKGGIVKKIKPELTYREMDEVDNIYSFLLFTGYLKKGKEIDKKTYELMIPNEEVREVYMNQFDQYFEEYKKGYKGELLSSLENENIERINEILNTVLDKSISYYDNKESFYHGFLVGMLQGYEVESNKESGDGRFDIVLYPKKITGKVIVIECKHSNSLATLIKDSQEGARQIIEKRYEEGIKAKGYLHMIGYGISFYKKQCYVCISD